VLITEPGGGSTRQHDLRHPFEHEGYHEAMVRRPIIVGIAFTVLIGGAVLWSVARRPDDSQLTAVDRETGTQLWTKSLERSGAQWVWQEDDQLVVFACFNGHVALRIDPASGKIVERRPHESFGSGDESDFEGEAVQTRAPGPGPFGLPTATELSYDDATHFLVSTKSWRIKVDVSGPDWMPVLIRPDVVYFIENAGECNGFD
jgi:hypothetical protein